MRTRNSFLVLILAVVFLLFAADQDAICAGAAPDEIPVGVYTYLSNLKNNAKDTGSSVPEYTRKFLGMCQKGGINTIFLGNTGSGDEEFRDIEMFLNLAKENGLRVVLQPTGLYYGTAERGEDDLTPDRAYQANTRKGERFLAGEGKAKVLSAENIFALSLREELKPEYVKGYLAYAKAISAKYPNLKLYMLFNRVETTKEMPPGVHGFWGVDHYPFFVHNKTGKEELRDEALFGYGKQLKKRFEAGNHFGSPPWIVLQGSATIRKADQGEALLAPKWAGNLFWSKYFPPPGGIRGQFWAAFVSGARGFFLYYVPSKVLPSPKHPEPMMFGSLNPDLSSEYKWEEYVSTVKGFRAEERFLAKLKPYGETTYIEKAGLIARLFSSGGNDYYWMLVNVGLEHKGEKKEVSLNAPYQRNLKLQVPRGFTAFGAIKALGDGIATGSGQTKGELNVTWRGGDCIITQVMKR